MSAKVGTTHARPVRELCEADIDTGVVPRFRSVVASQPNAVAVSDEHEELTYADVAARAAKVLGSIRATVRRLEPPAGRRGPDHFGAREPVAMLFGHHNGAVVSLLAVIASGHPVLVLDQRTPTPRLRQFVERAGARIILCDDENEPIARELSRHAVVPLRDGDHANLEILWTDIPDPGSVAALAFTSGSTGTPKPVANDHRLLIRDAWNSSIATGCYGADDVIAHTLPIAFHAGLTTTVHGLLVGATMRLYDARSRGIAGLPSFIAGYGCTIMITSPGILRAFTAIEPDPHLLTSLRSLTVAGETAYAGDVEAVRRLLPPRCVVRNRYGSSETGLISEYAVPSDHPELTGQLPVGSGVGRTVLDVVDDLGTPVEPGAVGTLTVTAPSVALGYWGLPDATMASFRDNADGTRTYRTSDLGRRLPDGSMQVVGRVDHSVKIRGYLVDPGEVDAALFSLPLVREAVVVGAKHPTDSRNRLVAYVVPARPGLEPSDLRADLRAALPNHMVPEVLLFVDSLPRNDRGKIDRSALPEPPPPAPVGGVDDVSEWEEVIARHWAEVLGVDVVGVGDDFFALGGDSLAAEAIMTRMVQELGVNPEVGRTATLAQHPVLRDFARRLQGRATVPRRALVPLRTDGVKAPLFCIAGGGGLGIAFQPLARRLDPERPFYALQSPVIESRGLPEISVKQIARRHLAVLRSVQPHGPYHLAGHSFGGIIAVEMAHRLRDAGEIVEHLIILDSFPPDPRFHPPLTDMSLFLRIKSAIAVLVTAAQTTSGGAGSGRLWTQSRFLGHRYTGKPWPGNTLVVVADSPQRFERSAWAGSLTGHWIQADVGGDHISMLRAPWVDEVAEHVNSFLSEPASRAPSASGART